MRIPRSLGLVSPSNPLVQSLVSAIAVQEGANSYNNPGNLLAAGQPGVIGVTPAGFAIFDSPASGAAAEAAQIALNVNRGTCATGAPVDTLTDLIAGCLTPASLNPNVNSYIAGVSAATGIDPNADLSSVLGGNGALAASPGPSAGDGSLSADTSDVGLDLTDPVTLTILLGAGALAWWAFSK